jgi:hypothetical protein
MSEARALKWGSGKAREFNSNARANKDEEVKKRVFGDGFCVLLRSSTRLDRHLRPVCRRGAASKAGRVLRSGAPVG